MSVLREGIFSFDVMNIAPGSDSSAEDITNLMIVVMVRTGQLNVGMG